MDDRDEIEYRSVVLPDYESIRTFLCEIGWERHVGDIDRFTRTLDNSDRKVVALERSRVIGFARAVCDDEADGYITMVAVSPDKRGLGVGSRIVKILIGDNPEIKWVLTSASGSTGFWEKLGFGFPGNIMVKPRAREVSTNKKPSAAGMGPAASETGFAHRVLRLVKSACRWKKVVASTD